MAEQEDFSLADLPPMPDQSAYTEQDSSLSLPDLPSPEKSHSLSPGPATNTRLDSTSPTRFTSTPAPSRGLAYSQSSTTTRGSTVRPSPASDTTLQSSQRFNQQLSVSQSLKSGASLSSSQRKLGRPSIESEVSTIAPTSQGDDDEEGAASFAPSQDDSFASRLSRSSSQSPSQSRPRRQSLELEDEGRHQSDDLNDRLFGPSDDGDSPSSLPSDPDLSDVSVSHDDSHATDAPSSTRVRMSAANVSTRRKPTRLAAAHQEASLKDETLGGGSVNMDSAFSPLREKNGNATVSERDYGRNASPRSSPFQSPRTSSSASKSHATPRYVPSPLSSTQDKIFATPFSGGSPDFGEARSAPRSAEVQRRRDYAVKTLASTSKPALAKGTPRPPRKFLASPASENGAGEAEGDLESEVSSSGDFTTTHGGKGNTSLPIGGGGAALEGTGKRFNAAKLNAYLHNLNTELTQENQSLAETLGNTTKDVEKLRKHNRRLEEQVREMSMSGMQSQSRSGISGSEEEEGDRSRVEELEEQLTGLIQSHGGINDLRQQLTNELGEPIPVLSPASRPPHPLDPARIANLESTVSHLKNIITDKDGQVDALREQLVALKSASPGSPKNGALVRDLQEQVHALEDELRTVEAERDARAKDVDQLKERFVAAGEASQAAVEEMRERIEALEGEVETRTAQNEEAQSEMAAQEEEWRVKSAALEKDLSDIIEAQEKDIEQARRDIAEERRQMEERMQQGEGAAIASLREKVGELQGELESAKEEKEELERRIARDDNAETVAHLEQEVIPSLESHITTLESTLADRNSSVTTLEADVAAKDAQIERLHAEMDDVEQKLEEVATEEADSKRQIEQHLESIAQLEEALDVSSTQLMQKEDDLETLRADLAKERNVVSSLSAQISQLSLTKAKSPLANEAYNGNRDSVITALEEELEEAQGEIQRLRDQLAVVGEQKLKATLEAQSLEIKTLESHKLDLVDRVNTLREQTSIQQSFQLSSPNSTANSSLHFRSIAGLQTPRTPGQFRSNLSTFSSPGGAADATISPLLAQIHQLEQIVQQLQTQLDRANGQIDDKLDKLEASGSGTIALAKQLSDARGRIFQLESELEHLLGEHGSLQRVRTRLTKVVCPECDVTFDANKVVQLRIDGSSISFDDTTKGPQVTESLRSALAGVTAKLNELRAENSDLRGASARAKELASEKALIAKRHAALEQDFAKASSEISSLQIELRSERSRVKTLSEELALSNRIRTSLNTRLESSEKEIRQVKRDLAAATAPEDVERLKREKAELVATRTELSRQLAAAHERAAQVDADLNSTKTSHASMQAQLNKQVNEIQMLHDSLLTRDAEKHLLQDERGDILRGVASLQTELSKVRQDAERLGRDVEAVKDRKAQLARTDSMMDMKAQLEEALAREQARREHVCASDPAELQKLKEKLAKAERKVVRYEAKVTTHLGVPCMPVEKHDALVKDLTSRYSAGEGPALDTLKSRHKSEVKSVMEMVRWQKAGRARELEFREDLQAQKQYLKVEIGALEYTIEQLEGDIRESRGRPRASPLTGRRKKPSFRDAVHAIMIARYLSGKAASWRNEEKVIHTLREHAYPALRGVPFPHHDDERRRR